MRLHKADENPWLAQFNVAETNKKLATMEDEVLKLSAAGTYETSVLYSVLVRAAEAQGYCTSCTSY